MAVADKTLEEVLAGSPTAHRAPGAGSSPRTNAANFLMWCQQENRTAEAELLSRQATVIEDEADYVARPDKE